MSCIIPGIDETRAEKFIAYVSQGMLVLSFACVLTFAWPLALLGFLFRNIDRPFK
jgi:hypothetical protein